MFDSSQKSTGTEYTPTIALLAVAFVFVPAVLLATNSWGYMALSLATVCSTACVGLAWLKWKKSSQLFIPSITTKNPGSK